jgi:cellulose synthase/poly-beta-1,6-N-acetylglucosamine synthase-like glycosyltransferase
MLTDWMHWVTSLHPDELWYVLGFLLFVDTPRYVGCTLVMTAYDSLIGMWNWLSGRSAPARYQVCPSVCVLLVGHNEGSTIGATLASIWGTYPRMEIIVVDDGSTDDMTPIAREFAATHPGVLVFRRDERGGKSSALNWGLRYTRAEIVVCVDTDSRISPTGLWDIVQPFADSRVGAVSAAVLTWNAFANLVTWLQAYEYRQTIFMGRMVQERLGCLGIVSGAFGAFRRTALEQVGAWDVGPGEDGDVTLRLRKAGYEIAVAPYAECHTNVPTAWGRLFKQRCRWDRTVITFECRKHIDMSQPWTRHFRLTNALLLMERWFFNIVCVFTYWAYALWLLIAFDGNTISTLILLYLLQLALEFGSALLLLCYSHTPGRDLLLAAVLPFVPLYQVFIKLADLVAILEEIFIRKSATDNFVPEKVRRVTWHW